MPRRVTRLPSGQFGVFSTIVDAYIFVGSEAECEDFLYCRGETAAREKVRRGVQDERFCSTMTDLPDGLNRFRYDVECAALNRSRAEFDELFREIPLTMAWVLTVSQTYEAVHARLAAQEQP